MITPLSNNTRGAGHIVAILAIVLALSVGISGWFVYQSQNSFSGPAKAAIEAASCDYDDKDLCRFFAAWKSDTAYRMTSDQTVEGKKLKITVEAHKGNVHSIVDGNEIYTETITTKDASFTRGTENGTWWKELKPLSVDASDALKIDEPTKDEVAKQYKKIGKEACGDRTCFKYEFKDKEDNGGGTTTIWFDDEQYLLREAEIQGPPTSKAIFSYDNVSIKAPSEYKELKEGDYLVPGTDEPVSAGDGSEADLEAFMDALAGQQ